jgi:DNA-binding MarR family transcriptional regulator
MAMRAAVRDAVGDLGLTPVQSTVLHLVADAPASSSAELARRTHVTPQTMHKLVTELEHRELLALRPRPGHGRIRDAHLTDRGRKLVAAADARARAIEDRMTAGLSRNQRQQLIDLLQHCTAALEAADEHQHPST